MSFLPSTFAPEQMQIAAPLSESLSMIKSGLQQAQFNVTQVGVSRLIASKLECSDRFIDLTLESESTFRTAVTFIVHSR